MTDKIKVGKVEATLTEICFPVEIRDEPMWCNQEYSRMVIGTIDGEEKKLNQMGNAYELVPNSDIFPKIEKVFNAQNIKFLVCYTHIKHAQFYANFRITDVRYAYTMTGTNDMIFPMLSVQHSYNGKTKYKIVFGYFRLVCTNGLVIPVAEMDQYNLKITGKHTDSILGSIEKLKELLIYFSENANVVTTAITAKFERLNSHKVVNVETRIKDVLKASGIIAVENNKFNTVNDLMNRISAEANKVGLGYNGRVNDWLVYNAINQYLHDDNRNIAFPEIRAENDSKVLEYMLATAA